MKTEYDLVSCDRVFARVEEELSSFSNNGLLDTGKFFPRIRLFIELLGIGGYIQDEAIVVVKDYKVELPRDFYLLDSAWLCDKCNSFTQSAFQGEFQIYTKKTCEEVAVNGCQYNSYFGIKTSDCPETILDKVTIEQWINSENTASITWRNPTLLSLGNKVSKDVCSKTCSNIFSKCSDNISIRKQGDCYVLYSNLKHATILLKYYKYPLDENNLPMIPDSPIFEEALFYDLQLYLFKQKWYNNEIVNVENKIKSLTEDRAYAMQRAVDLLKIPSVLELMQMANRQRSRLMTYEIAFPQRHINYRN
jgi:hypothetical protein